MYIYIYTEFNEKPWDIHHIQSLGESIWKSLLIHWESTGASMGILNKTTRIYQTPTEKTMNCYGNPQACS